jgi:excisionase family DNA binding protein
MERLLRASEAAEVLSVSTRTVYALVASGKLRACRIGVRGGTIRFHPRDLASYIADLRRGRDQSPDAPLAGDAPGD